MSAVFLTVGSIDDIVISFIALCFISREVY